MSERNNTGREKPLSIYSIRREEGERSYWTKIGVAFKNSDGSLQLRFDALPLGACQVRRDKPKEERGRS